MGVIKKLQGNFFKRNWNSNQRKTKVEDKVESSHRGEVGSSDQGKRKKEDRRKIQCFARPFC